jgi:predicted permease
MATTTALDTLVSDARLALRRLRRGPGLLAAIVITLAAGIGANTAVYAVVHTLLIEPPPYRDPSRLVLLWAHIGAAGLTRAQLAGPETVELTRVSAFAGAAAIRAASASLTGGGEPERVQVAHVSWGLFDLLGTGIAQGRGFTAADADEASPPALISWSLFERRFGANADVVNQAIVLDDIRVTVVGVLPRAFHLDGRVTGQPAPPQIFRPLGAGLVDEHRLIRPYRVVARLAPGATIEQAGSQVDAIRTALASAHPFYASTDHRFWVAPLHGEGTRDIRPILMALLAAVVVVLAAACVNAGGLLTARAAARLHETSTLLALGASRGRLARQYAIEGLAITAAGGLAGLATGWAALRVMTSMRPPGLERLQDVTIAAPVVGAVAAVALLWGLLFALAPLSELRRADPAARLRQSTRGATRTRSRTRAALVVTQVALGTMLVVLAGLMVRTVDALNRVDGGFDTTARALTFRLGWPAARYPSGTEVNAFSRELESRLRALPGVTSVDAISHLPFDDTTLSGKYFADEKLVSSGVARVADIRGVSPEALPHLGVTLLEGRWFSEHDDRGAVPVSIVDERLAERAWPGQSPLGKRLRVPLYVDRNVAAIWTTVVGVVRHVRQRSLDADGQEEVYVPFRQTLPASMAYIVRTAIDPAPLAPDVRRTIASLDPQLPAYNVRPLEHYIARAVAARRFAAALVAAFAVLALILAAIGLAGLAAFSVASRRREFGVRLALGATPAGVRRAVLKESFLLIGAGLAVGLAGSAAAAHAIRAVLFGVAASDPTSYAGAVAVLALTGLAASWWPAHVAGSVSAADALRAE